MKAPRVERKVSSYNFQHVHHQNLIFTLTTCTLTMNESFVSKNLVDFDNLISNVRGKQELYVIDI